MAKKQEYTPLVYPTVSQDRIDALLAFLCVYEQKHSTEFTHPWLSVADGRLRRSQRREARIQDQVRSGVLDGFTPELESR